MPSLLGLNFHKKKSTDNLKGLSPLHSINREDSNHSGSNNNNNTVQHHVHYAGADSVSPSHHQQHHHHNRSFNELTRFFRSSMRKKSTTSSQMNLTRSAEHHSHTQSAIPPSSDSTLSLANKTSIYHDDSILAQKYGKLGKVLGSGAGGSVKVLVRPSDGRTFAVKQFRQRRPGESVKDYARKCTSEYMIGSMLHHPNVIETLDVFSDSKQNQYYEVMEYCPVDFFSVVMSGQMSRGEINCCFKQLVEGVNYLHTKGYAHRDLKLDNCVMTRDGILKLIDFGSAFVFKYTYEADEKLAHGIVGSDPYLAPEVLTSTKSYSAPLVDVWSIAIIFCCMMLKRFPWKEPRLTDNNFKVYCMTDDQEHDYEKSARDHELLMQKRREERLREKAAKLETENKLPTPPTDGSTKHSPNELPSGATEEPDLNSPDINTITIKDDSKAAGQHRNHSPEQTALPKEAAGPASHTETNSGSTLNGNAVTAQKKQKRVIRGPYILLRLLPHASRPIMARMLQVDPAKRARMQDVLNDSWYKSIPSCTMDEHKNIIRAPSHSHTIVSEENTHVETYKV